MTAEGETQHSGNDGADEKADQHRDERWLSIELLGVHVSGLSDVVEALDFNVTPNAVVPANTNHID